MTSQLFTGSLVRLTAPNPDTDIAPMATWSRDSEFQRLLATRTARPWTAAGLKQEFEETMGKDEPKLDEFTFMMRTLADDRLIGFIGLSIPHWAQRDAWLGVGIGERGDWGRGYGSDAVRLILRYGFAELNLRRVTLNVFAYNERAYHSYLKVGFKEEGRTRESLRREGRRWDMIFMGILREEWEQLADDVHSGRRGAAERDHAG